MENLSNSELVLIGITGGISSGKTAFAQYLAELGYTIIYTDQLAKEIISTNSIVKNQIINTFGENSFIDGKYNTDYISEIVFNDNSELDKLNRIVFPVVIDKLVAEIDKLQINNGSSIKDKLLFIESALLFEFNIDGGFDYIISVSSNIENRKERLKNKLNISDNELMKRINIQMSQEEKNKLSDFVIENNGTIKDLENSASFLLPILKSLPNKEDYAEDK